MRFDKMKRILIYLLKLPLCGIGYFIGMSISGIAISGIVLPKLGFRPPELPAGTDANTIALWFLLGSMILAFALSFVSRNLRVNWLVRWIILAELTWVFGAVGMVLESFFFMTTGAVSSLKNALFTVFSFLLPSLILSFLVAILFKPAQPIEPWFNPLKDHIKRHKLFARFWRGIAAFLAYPLTYFAFGMVVQPFIKEFYATGQFELTVPTWGQMIPLQLVRSLMFLMVSLPVIIWWGGSRRRLWLALGISIFALTAFMAVITAYWFPWEMRLFHGLELLADALVYTWALTLLFSREQPIVNSEKPDFKVTTQVPIKMNRLILKRK